VSALATTEPSEVDRLATAWWNALEAAQTALRTAAAYLNGSELSEHARRLSTDRSEAVSLLAALARDRQTTSPLLDRLAGHTPSELLASRSA
jgi:hypothetical protein